MSKSVASEYKDSYKSGEISEKMGNGDEEKQNGEESIEIPSVESLMISKIFFTVPASNDQFMHTPEFRRHFVEYVSDDTLMALGLATKPWMREIESLLRRIVENGGQRGEVIVNGGKNLAWTFDEELDEFTEKLSKEREVVTRVIFLLNITKVGDKVCWWAINLVVVDIPEGVESIGEGAFSECRSLTTVSFPTTLTSIGEEAFDGCCSLDNVDLLHTNLRYLGCWAFGHCINLKSMTIPDSLNRMETPFKDCPKLVPYNNDAVSSALIITHLRAQQKISELKQENAELQSQLEQANTQIALNQENTELQFQPE
ncbi:hypothetical protein TL16_g07031 [Triparma laevis f. inornata]|uniref:Leucine-rich repeat domain-containing protein n=1 Tax=Triparma laevis f. inornata TaxID=1714386 RepID=A0A9W7ANN0_9STRA|nr:hypothetical protein TL16_g07031 [Triparma laevis f. inornata]